MTLAVVGTSHFTETAAATTLNGSRACTAGNGLVLIIGTRTVGGTAGTISGVSDGFNTYAQVTYFTNAQGGTLLDAWYCPQLATGGTLSFTITLSTSGCAAAWIIEVSGQATGLVGSSTPFLPNAGQSFSEATGTVLDVTNGPGGAGAIMVGVGDYNLSGQSVSGQTWTGIGGATFSNQVNVAQITSAVPGLYLNMAPSYVTVGNSAGDLNFQETIAASTQWNCGQISMLPATGIYTISFSAGLGMAGQVGESGPSGGKSQFVGGSQTMSHEGLGWVADLTLDPSQATLTMAGSLTGVLIGTSFPPPPPPLPPPVFGPPGRLERISAQSLHTQPGNQLQRSTPNTLHKQTQ